MHHAAMKDKRLGKECIMPGQRTVVLSGEFVAKNQLRHRVCMA